MTAPGNPEFLKAIRNYQEDDHLKDIPPTPEKPKNNLLAIVLLAIVILMVILTFNSDLRVWPMLILAVVFVVMIYFVRK